MFFFSFSNILPSLLANFLMWHKSFVFSQLLICIFQPIKILKNFLKIISKVNFLQECGPRQGPLVWDQMLKCRRRYFKVKLLPLNFVFRVLTFFQLNLYHPEVYTVGSLSLIFKLAKYRESYHSQSSALTQTN